MGWSQKKFKNKKNINLIYFYKNNLKKKTPNGTPKHLNSFLSSK
jgi:hypothetical protein